MDLKRAETYSEYNIRFVYLDKNGLIRKHIYHERTEVEQLTFISLCDEAGDAIFITYQARNNMTDEKGFVYLNKGEVILENSVTYPYYEEYDVDGRLVVEGEKVVLQQEQTVPFHTKRLFTKYRCISMQIPTAFGNTVKKTVVLSNYQIKPLL
ncbi:MAG: hypothetical protein LBG19_01920 [Prevotellaceae bacterium]|jgi:hypothetical protein|nr:hypothetical protein [Prevotellaceae bacterium]